MPTEVSLIKECKMSLIPDYLSEYIDDIQPYCKGALGELQAQAYEENLPIIHNDVARLLAVLLEMVQPKRILEIGMAVGFSASFMCGYLQKGGHLVTIDRYPIMIEAAKENFKKMGVEDMVTMKIGHAEEVLAEMDDEFDFIFMDAAKGKYIEFLPHCLRMLRKGGLIVADDVLQDGRVAQKYEEIPRRQRTIHKRMNEFLETISNDPKLTSSILTIGDGVAVIRKRED